MDRGPAAVTFRQLLTHTGGLAPWRSVFRDGGLEAVYGYPFVARPGTEFHYSDLGFMLLGEAVARLFRAPLDVAMQALVRDRLGLDSLTYAPSRTGRPQRDIAPTSIDEDWRGRRCWGEADDENAASLDGVAGHAGLFATADDVARFGVAWLRRDPRLRLPAYWTTATSDQTPGLGAARGLGWQLAPADGSRRRAARVSRSPRTLRCRRLRAHRLHRHLAGHRPTSRPGGGTLDQPWLRRPDPRGHRGAAPRGAHPHR